MKKCKKCGTVYEGEQKFCKKCGAPLTEADEKTDIQETAGERKKSKIWIYIAIGILAAALAGGTLAAVKIHDNKEKEEIEREEERKREEQEEDKEKEEKDKKEKDLDTEETQKDSEKTSKDSEKTSKDSEKTSKDSEKTKEEKEKEEEKKKEEEEQAELLKKYEEQEAAEAKAKADEEAKAAAAANAKAAAAAAAESGANSPSVQSSASLYDAWSSKLANAEYTDSGLIEQAAATEEYNGWMEKQQERYNLWDALLNEMWQDLKNALPESSMKQLTDDQVAWIHEKEAMIAEYWDGTNVEHSSFSNAPAANTTKERLYYLLNMCPMN